MAGDDHDGGNYGGAPDSARDLLGSGYDDGVLPGNGDDIVDELHACGRPVLNSQYDIILLRLVFQLEECLFLKLVQNHDILSSSRLL